MTDDNENTGLAPSHDVEVSTPNTRRPVRKRGETRQFTFKTPTGTATYNVRALRLDGAWWLHASDVLKAAGYKKMDDGPTPFLADLGEAHKRTIVAADAPKTFFGNANRAALVSPRGVNQMLGVSNRRQAKQVREWIVTEVLPALKSGFGGI